MDHTHYRFLFLFFATTIMKTFPFHSTSLPHPLSCKTEKPSKRHLQDSKMASPSLYFYLAIRKAHPIWRRPLLFLKRIQNCVSSRGATHYRLKAFLIGHTNLKKLKHRSGFHLATGNILESRFLFSKMTPQLLTELAELDAFLLPKEELPQRGF